MGEIRIGMVTPSSNTALEPALAAMAADLPGLSIHVSRFRVTEISLSPAGLDQFALAPMAAAADLLADAMVCTNLRGTAAAPALERELGIPVLESIAVTLWGALRLLDVDTSALARWGRLFALPRAGAAA